MNTPRRLIRDPEGLNTGSWPVPPQDFITPVDRFFTRSHAAVPRIDPQSWRLEIGGLVEHPRSYSLPELMSAFTRRTVAATLVCAGLRRDEFLHLGPLPGELPWGPEPVSAGEWTGLALGDLLQAIGVKARGPPRGADRSRSRRAPWPGIRLRRIHRPGKGAKR